MRHLAHLRAQEPLKKADAMDRGQCMGYCLSAEFWRPGDRLGAAVDSIGGREDMVVIAPSSRRKGLAPRLAALAVVPFVLLTSLLLLGLTYQFFACSSLMTNHSSVARSRGCSANTTLWSRFARSRPSSVCAGESHSTPSCAT